MRRIHFLLLIITAILAVSSAYSLTAINQVYSIGFEWYSQYNRIYEAGQRDMSKDRFIIPVKKITLKAGLIDSEYTLGGLRAEMPSVAGAIAAPSLNDDIYVYCSLGPVDSPEYRVKVVDIAQRGNNMEIKVSVNTPETVTGPPPEAADTYMPFDVARIAKSALPSRGRLYVVFKDQEGREIFDQYCYVA